jgi:hypothetical protein
MGRSKKNRDKKRQHSYYDEDYSNSKKYKKSRFEGNRRDKEIRQKMFVDWDTL